MTSNLVWPIDLHPSRWLNVASRVAFQLGHAFHLGLAARTPVKIPPLLPLSLHVAEDLQAGRSARVLSCQEISNEGARQEISLPRLCQEIFDSAVRLQW